MGDELPERIWIERGENSGGHMRLLVVPGHDGGDEYIRADLAIPAPPWQPTSDLIRGVLHRWRNSLPDGSRMNQTQLFEGLGRMLMEAFATTAETAETEPREE